LKPWTPLFKQQNVIGNARRPNRYRWYKIFMSCLEYVRIYCHISFVKVVTTAFLWCAKNSFNCHRKVVGFQPPQLNKISVVIRGTSTPVHNCAGSNWAGFANSETLKKGWALKNSLACEIPGLVNIQKTMENHHAIHGK
jgi:hypothetical protein